MQRDLERDLVAWFDERSSTPPHDLLSRALARIDTIGQRPGFLTRDRYMGRALRLGSPPLLSPVVLLLVLLLSAAVVVVGSQLIKPRPSLVTTTDGVWQQSDQVAFRVQLDPTLQLPAFKWRAGTYSEYTATGWEWGEVARQHVPARELLDVFSQEGDGPTTVGRRRIQITIAPETFRDKTILGPNMIELVDRSTEAVTLGTDGWYASIESTEDVGPYTITALIPDVPDVAGAFTEARLRAAGTTYSPGMLATYVTLPVGALGPASTALLEDIRGAVVEEQDPVAPYDLARTIETYLRDSANFTYSEDVRDEVRRQCAGVSTVECFALIREGYCEYYASTMAVLLRASGVPARVAYGFLPGDRGLDGTEVVGSWAAHWWVEVYFPGVGWFEFDPTGGGVGQPQPIPSRSASFGPAAG
jgi:transglutaminase-like putative cysteine protease